MVVLSSFTPPESPVVLEQQNTRVFLDQKDYGLGRLYISERTICWKGEGNLGFSLTYPHVSLHAISKDPQVCPTECIYIMIDAHVDMPGSDRVPQENAIDADDSSDDDSGDSVSEMLLVPEDVSAINVMYQALTDCQALNPDPEDMSDDEDQMYQDAEDEGIDIGGGGDVEMENITNRMSENSICINYEQRNGSDQGNDDQFEDAD